MDLHLEEERLDLAQRRRVSGHYAIVPYYARNAGANIRDRGEDDERVGDGAQALEEAVGDKDHKDAEKAKDGPGPLDALNLIALLAGKIHVVADLGVKLEELGTHHERGERGTR